MTDYRAGFVSFVGRPNVGKSTLLNALVGAKVAIVSPKPQTTRNRILGIRTLPEAQVIFLDTPGIHAARSMLNRRMVETAEQTLGEADAALLVLDATAGVTPADRELATRLAALGRPTIVVLNKRDRVRPPTLLPQMEAISREPWHPNGSGVALIAIGLFKKLALADGDARRGPQRVLLRPITVEADLDAGFHFGKLRAAIVGQTRTADSETLRIQAHEALVSHNNKGLGLDVLPGELLLE